MPQRPWNARADLPDLRDRIYEPNLTSLPQEVLPRVSHQDILDQKSEGACTGFALAAAINFNYRQRGMDLRVSPRMLYEMAKRFDEWQGVNYEGSSIRGAIRGWQNNGVCLDSTWPYRTTPGRMSIKRAKEARNHTVGAYYRVRPEISEVHAALAEAGIIICSAQVHGGWDRVTSSGRIPFRKKVEGGHAFAIVGYDHEGFWIQNSWGVEWGKNGLGLWRYEDWIKNVMDAWVIRLTLPTPQIFGERPQSSVLLDQKSKPQVAKVRRQEIAGHFVHVDDGKFKTSGTFHSDLDDVRMTAELLSESQDYDHFLIYGHGGLNSPKDSACRVRAMKEVYKANRIYPFHIMYDTGLAEELGDIISRKGAAARQRVAGFGDWLDRRIECLLEGIGRKVWEEMKNDAKLAFAKHGPATKSIEAFLEAFDNRAGSAIKIHIIGHSTGAILFAHMLRALAQKKATIDTCTLLAPACDLDLYHSHYLPILKGEANLKLKSLDVLNLTDQLELDDDVAKIYQKSLLYLVSNAFERGNGSKPLLGMEKYQAGVDVARGKTVIHLSNGVSGQKSRSTTHGGFDNDPVTMNYILKRILEQKPTRPFTAQDLAY